jgi:hypothetical protein
MNSRFVPADHIQLSGRATNLDAAVVTASYAPDFERCRLLCDTMDRWVTGVSHHYLLVEAHDVALFKSLEGPRRTVIDEREILPNWLRSFSDPASGFKRRIWLSTRTKPLRGWHVQQLRRIGIASQVEQPVLVYCDSDVAFLTPFDLSAFSKGDKVRLFRRDGAMAAQTRSEHHAWMRNAGMVLGLDGAPSTHDYISTLISWRRRSVMDMCAHIEKLSGRHWAQAIGTSRRFSECLIYGRYVDEVTAGVHHFHGAEEWCHVQWFGTAMSDAEISDLLFTLRPEQVAIAIQSFTGTDIRRIRELVGVDG